MVAIQVPEELASQIERGAQRTGQSNDVFLRQAVSSYMEDLLLEQQELAVSNLPPETVNRLRESISQLDRGETVSSHEMEAFFDEWEQEAKVR